MTTKTSSVSLSEVARDLSAGVYSAAELVEGCLARIEDPDGEGSRTFLAFDADAVRTGARVADAQRAKGLEPSAYAGIPVSTKDNFDVRGQTTKAGSVVLDRGPAARDAEAVARWRQAGLVLAGRTNMTEFAYSGLGLNPHHGTPTNPWDRERRLIPGGSSSGAAVSVADSMVFGALGSDTGGSCRIPAAFCGLVGFKPSQSQVSRDGLIPLSTTLDAVGVIGRTVRCCAVLYGLLTHAELDRLTTPPRPPRLAVPHNYFLRDADQVVAGAFGRSLDRLTEAGAELIEIDLPELGEIAEISAGGGFPAAESFAWHRDLIAEHAGGYDPRVLSRISRGEKQSARELLGLHDWRRGLIAKTGERLGGFDGFLAPTVPFVAPPLGALEENDDEYSRLNLLALRNPTVVNLLNGCAISLPMNDPGEPPSGLMLASGGGEDIDLLRTSLWMEDWL